MARGIQGLPKVSPEPAMPFYALWADYPQNILKAVSGVPCLQGALPAGRVPPWIPQAVQACPTFSHILELS
jgi:hypothetical protein